MRFGGHMVVKQYFINCYFSEREFLFCQCLQTLCPQNLIFVQKRNEIRVSKLDFKNFSYYQHRASVHNCWAANIEDYEQSTTLKDFK